MVRQAMQAALDMDEIMDAASDGNYRLNVGFQYPNQPDYTDAGKETYNLQDPALGEEISGGGRLQGRAGGAADQQGLPADVQLGPGHAAAAAGGRHQCRAEGGGLADLGADGAETADTGWNFFFTGWGTQPALGALATMQFLVPPDAIYKPKDGKDDPDLLAALARHEHPADPKAAQAAFARMQKLVLRTGLCRAVRVVDQGAGACGRT